MQLSKGGENDLDISSIRSIQDDRDSRLLRHLMRFCETRSDREPRYSKYEWMYQQHPPQMAALEQHHNAKQRLYSVAVRSVIGTFDDGEQTLTCIMDRNLSCQEGVYGHKYT